MARIRTIKPEFFSSEDIVGLAPLTRLLYIAIWCEADKEGRLVWKPLTFKFRYFPADDCDIKAMCAELVDRGLIELYGEGYAFIPTFKAHQHINPRETPSQLPEPKTTRQARVGTRQARSNHAQGGREGKGREGDTPETGEKPQDLFAEFWTEWPASERKQAKGKCEEAWGKSGFDKHAESIMAHVKQMKTSESWTKKGGEFIPAPMVYLNQRRWEGAESGASGLQTSSLGHYV